MQDSVFKVPRVKKRWQSLYCTEAISELDDVWEVSQSRDGNSRMKSITSVKGRNESRSCNRQLFMNCPADMNLSSSDGTEEAMKGIPPKDTTFQYGFYFKQEPLVTMDEDGDDCFNLSQNIYTTALLDEFASPQRSDSKGESSKFNYQNKPKEAMKCIPPKDTTPESGFYFKQEPLVTMDEDEDGCFNVSQNIYTTGLLDEFCSNSQRSDSIKESSEFNYQNGPDKMFMTSGSPPWQKLHNKSNQSWGMGGELSPNRTIDETDFSSPQSPDVLIVRDESMANADSPQSDVDWDSLTPPAPRSPCDHTVPDLDDLSTLSPPGDFLLYSGPFPAYQMEGEDISEQENSQGTGSMRHHLTYQSTDHIVPDLYS